MQRSPQSPPPRKNFDRFFYYFSGLAIGFVMLGVLTQARTCQAQRSGVGAPAQGQPANGVSTPQTKP